MWVVSSGSAARAAAESVRSVSERALQPASAAMAMMAEIDLARITGITHESVCGVSLRLWPGCAKPVVIGYGAAFLHRSIGFATPLGRNGIAILRPCPADAYAAYITSSTTRPVSPSEIGVS